MSADAAPKTPPSGDSPSGFAGLLGSVINVGRDILARRRQAAAEAPSGDLVTKCRQLLHHRGEASGLALACEIISDYQRLDDANRQIFFKALAHEFEAPTEAVMEAIDAYRAEPTEERLTVIAKAVEAPRAKLFRRMNMAPSATPVLVALRGDLLRQLPSHPELRRVDADLKQQFISWFNRGFLELRVIDWRSPAAILEKIIQYESVHEIQGWEDLRSRLRENRLCFAFFHPAMPDDPLVFVEVALNSGIPGAIAPLLDHNESSGDTKAPDTVVFYSISNCHPGLAGVSFGNFLIKQVVEEIGKRHPKANRYVTLSPIPGFCQWLAAQQDTLEIDIHELRSTARIEGNDIPEATRDILLRLCAQYLVNERSGEVAIDPVARFHLGNGASLHAIHWAADLSDKGLQQSIGMMVNYLYDLDSIEENHDAYFDQGEVAISRTVARLLN